MTSTSQGNSTAATAGAGVHFEGQVAAYYLLTLLAGGDARGLPGVTLSKIALQQANQGRPLDDVIVSGISASGTACTLDIQVKRTATFSPKDPVFRDVVKQIAQAMKRDGFWDGQHELAIATERGPRSIDGAYQDLLALARNIGDPAIFFIQLELAGVANDSMRSFVSTFRSHLQAESAAHDDRTVWMLLRRLQILPFDFTSSEGESQVMARERVLRVLHPEETPRADAFWRALVELAFEIAKHQGDRTRTTLLELLRPLDFRLSGERRHAAARTALAERTRQALEEIDLVVGQVQLARRERLDSIHAAFDAGRYVELRGDAGVGKSGVLRLCAEAYLVQAQVLVLSPGRCAKRGGASICAEIGFEGTLHEFLAELASDGGAMVFLDNLDSMDAEEQRTVVDVVRAAEKVSGVRVLATARLDFGEDGSSWMPHDALDRLGRGPTISLNALTEAEIEQLKLGNPTLGSLLAPEHPARQLTTNLFRLARIAKRNSDPGSDPVPLSETEMALQWWKSADGDPQDAGWRERSRVLAFLATQALTTQGAMDVREQPAAAVDALVRSGTLRNLSAHKVDFRHDVFREWAIACAIHEDATLFERIDLSQRASATLGRGVELLARLMIERAARAAAWNAMLARCPREGVHPSWRRAVLLALVRTEAAIAVLETAHGSLDANGGTLLRELVRTVMSVESVPAAIAFAKLPIDLNLLPAGMTVPKGLAWFALAAHLLVHSDTLPSAAVPDVVDFFTGLSTGTFGLGPMVPRTTTQIYRWLRMLEPLDGARDMPRKPHQLHAIGWEELRTLRESLRAGFLMFSSRVPALAAEYLEAVLESESNDDLAEQLVRSPGTLVAAAPALLALLTAKALIERPPRKTPRLFGDERAEPFTFLDHQFIPCSPGQGPFFELLQQAPKEGLSLVRRLVDHAVSYASGGREPGDDEVLDLTVLGISRRFVWTDSYGWSRNSNFYAMTSALMALEVWAHRRLERGDALDAVLADVLGDGDIPAAYLLIAADLVLSHWPKTVDASLGLLASPELLCRDRHRQGHDQMPDIDFFWIGALRPEPAGKVSLTELKRKASRQINLEGLFCEIREHASAEQLAWLKERLEAAAVRLGSPGEDDNFGDPRFMAQHVLHLLDPANWVTTQVTQKEGTVVSVLAYRAPPQEAAHLARLTAARAELLSADAMRDALIAAVFAPARMPQELQRTAVAWAIAQGEAGAAAPVQEGRDKEFAAEQQEEAIVSAAMQVMRDGDEELRAAHAAWAMDVLVATVQSDPRNPVHESRGGLRYNRVAIATLGLVHSLKFSMSRTDIRRILELAVSDHHAAAHGFGAGARTLAAVDARLPRTVLRCALVSCIVFEGRWDATLEDKHAQAQAQQALAVLAVDAELAWIFDSAQEPAWPEFPAARPRSGYRMRLLAALDATDDGDGSRDVDEDSNVDIDGEADGDRLEAEEPEGEAQAALPVVRAQRLHAQSAALWVKQWLRNPTDAGHPWLLGFVAAYMPWTIKANGGELSEGDEAEDAPREWTIVFFDAVAEVAASMPLALVHSDILEPICSLPEQNFYDVLVNFLRSFDQLYFNGSHVTETCAVEVRSRLATHMMSTHGWTRLRGAESSSIEVHLGPAVAALAFNDFTRVAPSKCYLLPPGIASAEPMLATLTRLAKSAPSPFLAVMLLNFLEVAPSRIHMPLLATCGAAWLAVYPDSRSFWIDHGLGRRWCEVVRRVVSVDLAALAENVDDAAVIERVVARLVRVGIPEAAQLESSWGNDAE